MRKDYIEDDLDGDQMYLAVTIDDHTSDIAYLFALLEDFYNRTLAPRYMLEVEALEKVIKELELEDTLEARYISRTMREIYQDTSVLMNKVKQFEKVKLRLADQV